MPSTYLLPRSPFDSLDEYLATDTGGLGWQRAFEIGPAATRAEVAASGLRGRGGGGFPTARKWDGAIAQGGARRYLVVNGAEGEPGTFKDRAIMRSNPYQLVEGIVIAAHAVGATSAYLCLKASFGREIAACTRAIQEMQKAGIGQECEIIVVEGPDEYLYGEEKAMLEVIEGNEPLPRLLPPYQHGLFATTPQEGWSATRPGGAGGASGESNPTVVNNVETISNLPHILSKGVEWFRSMGTPESPGNVICTVVGTVATPDVGEVPFGTPLQSIIDQIGGGVAEGHAVKAVLPGVANAVATAEHLGTPVSYEAFAAIGSGIGSCGFIVLDDHSCMVDAARQMSQFLWVESCGQCPPCKRGSAEITAHLDAIEAGTGTDHDIEQIGYWLERVTDGNRCYLAVEEQTLVASVLRAFPEEFAAHIEQRRCPLPREVLLAKIVDLDNGVATYDVRQAAKQPDWTYAT